MTNPREALAERIRAVLAGTPLREQKMFGGISFMVDDQLLVAAQGHGDLLVRVDPERHDELTGVPGARTAEMGAGRTMGPGWVSVAPDALGDHDALSFWIRTALERSRRAR